MPATTITISREQRDGLYELTRNDLRGDAGIVLLDREESAEDAETKRRFQQGYDACGHLLASLDPRAGERA